MAQRVITTGGYPVEMEDAQKIKSDVIQDVGQMKFRPDQIDGLSTPVQQLLDAQTQEEMRNTAGVNNAGIAVKGDPGPQGPPGQNVDLTVANDAIQWKRDDESAWSVLVALDEITGPQGEAGNKGETGAVGAQGPKGEPGDTGPQGPVGETGQQGPKGDTGPKGDKGDSGAQGIQGLKGDTGLTGSAGAKGEQGIQGVQGPKGDTGATGAAGATGAKGDAGPTGPQGNPGVNATTTTNATTTAAGLMSANDKAALDRINTPVTSVVASSGRPVGTSFTISTTRNARVSYSFGYTLTSTLALGQTILIVCTVDGVEVARMADGVILGLAGNVQKTKSVTFDVPAGKAVLFTKSGTSSVTATVVSGQETLL